MSKVLQSCELVAKEADIKIDLACAKDLANKVRTDTFEKNLRYFLNYLIISFSF